MCFLSPLGSPATGSIPRVPGVPADSSQAGREEGEPPVFRAGEEPLKKQGWGVLSQTRTFLEWKE